MLRRAFSLNDAAVDADLPVPRPRPRRVVLPSRFTDPAAAALGPSRSRSPLVVPRPGARASSKDSGVSIDVPKGVAAQSEAAARDKLALALANACQGVAEHSEVLESLQTTDASKIAFLFQDRAPTTLRRHLGGWLRWLQFCRASNVHAGCPTHNTLLDFLEALAEGASSFQLAGRC